MKPKYKIIAILLALLACCAYVGVNAQTTYLGSTKGKVQVRANFQVDSLLSIRSSQYNWISAPAGLANKTSFFFDATGRMTWRNGTGYLRTFDATGITADRVYSLPDATTSLAGLSVSNTFTERQLITPPSLTGSSATSAFSISQTWNTTGNPTAIFLNVTNTASGATSTLMRLQTDGINQFKVNKSNSAGVTIGNDGATTISGGNYRAYISWTAVRLHFKDDTGNERMNIGNEGVAIGKPDANNVASSILELQSTTKGFLPSRMTATQASNIASPAEGLLIYVTNTNGTFTAKGWWGYNGSTWEKLNN